MAQEKIKIFLAFIMQYILIIFLAMPITAADIITKGFCIHNRSRLTLFAFQECSYKVIRPSETTLVSTETNNIQYIDTTSHRVNLTKKHQEILRSGGKLLISRNNSLTITIKKVDGSVYSEALS